MLRRQKFVGVRRCLSMAGLAFVITVLVVSGHSRADVLTSPNYQLQPTVANSFGGSFGSSDYKLIGSGGEAAIGRGAGGSYKLGAGFAAELQHSINLYVEPAGLIGYWPMNEASGPTVHDASANSNDGTLSGGVSWANGKIGGGLNFAGTPGQFLSLPNGGPYASFGTTDFTVSSWVKTSSASEEVIFSTAGSSQGFRFGYSNGKPYYLVGSGGASSQEGTIGNVTLNDGNWHFLSISYDYNSTWTVKAYIDGDFVGKINTSVVGSVDAGSQPMIGAMTASAHNVNGVIDDVKIYSRALDPEEASANYEAGLAGFNSGLVLPPIQTGHSQTVGADVIVSADAPYTLITRETGPLTLVTNSAVTIPSFGGSIANPASWDDNVSEGLGFTLLSGPNGVPSKWGSGTKYAAVPLNATSFYNRSGFTGGAKDVVKLQYRLGVNAAQTAGRYKNNVVYTATMTP